MTVRDFSLPRPYFGITKGAAAKPASGGKAQRAPRRLIEGLALRAQKCRLVVTSEVGEIAYSCRVVDVANGGFCITLLGEARFGAPPGTQAVLEQTDKSRMPVELRWQSGPTLGLKRLPRGR